ncbi:MAG: endonuclease domain-containing protein [Sphingosinicella sp.]
MTARRLDPKHTKQARELRNNPTDAELTVWHMLSRYRPKFTRQLPIGPFKADLACRKARLIVELDGSQHADCPRDEARTRYLEGQGWTVIRFWNSDVS